MKLKQIKISGFKSFVDLTIIDVNGNLVGIVGPNGCGKSNVIDAVRWVLGESSARQLRGDSMQDVIFNGSIKRKAVSRASVELIFDNSTKIISGMWSTYDEISIKRLISRSADSAYYINNQVVRRKDITELFLGTGVGTRGYAIIEQGMISRVIDAKPEELRQYLEEASGVSKYREKRKDTVAKLHDTKDNLVRIEDINSELEKQINSLTIQAESAHQYQNLQNELKLQQFTLTRLKIVHADAILNKVNVNIEDVYEDTKKVEATLEQTNKILEKQLILKHVKDKELAQITEKFNLLRTNIARLEERYEHNKTLNVRINEDKLKLTQESEELKTQIYVANEHILEFETTITNNNNEIEEKQLISEEKLINTALIEDEYNKISLDFSNKQSEINEKKHELDILKNTYEHKKQQLHSLNGKLKKLEQEKAENIFDFDQSYFAIKDEIKELEIEITHIESELITSKSSKLKLGLEIGEIANKLSNVKSEKTAAISRLATIKELLYKQISLKGVNDDFINPDDILSPLWENLVVTPGYELAVEVVLGDVLNALHISEFNKIKKIPDSLFSFWIVSNKRIVITNKENDLETLDKFVKVKSEELNNIYDILTQYIVCDNFDMGLTLVNQLNDEQIIVTKDGHLLSKNYVTFNALSSQNHILEYQNKMISLESEISDLDTKLAKLEDELLQKETEHSKYEHNVSKLEDLCNQNLKKKHELQLKFTKEEQVYIQNKLHQERVTKEYNLLEKEIEYIANEIEEIKIKLEDGEIDIKYLHEKLNLAESEKKEIETKYNLAKSELHKLDELLNIKTTDNQILQQKINSTSVLIGEKQTNIERNNSKILTLEEEIRSITSSSDDSELKVMQDEIVDLTSTIENENKEIDKLGIAIAKLREEISKSSVQKEELVEKSNQLALKQQEQMLIIQNYNEILSELSENSAFDTKTVKLDGKNIQVIQEQINKLDSQIEALGLVNLKAIEDLEICNNKHQEITDRVLDLKESITMLEGAILQIDEETRVLLTDTYNKVNEVFAVYFKTLFGGGNASLELANEDILQAGMQIFAQPPGKKNSSIQLLSGGEKALTAMSLVFAFFNLNPAPFCLLDEVDAPLDDANTSRFCNLVQELAAKIQFIYISHNRLTMEMADQLVGVTMQEKGISTTVSVNLVEAVKHAV